jgi:lipopolysaccharide transport system permease protein
MFGLLLLNAWPLTWNVLGLPALLAITLLLSVGFSLIISALNVYYRDFMYALPFAIQVMMYATPVVYSIDIVPEALQPIFALNPLVGVVEGFRWALLGTGTFPLLPVALSLVTGVVLFVAGALIFQRVEQNFADVI